MSFPDRRPRTPLVSALAASVLACVAASSPAHATDLIGRVWEDVNGDSARDANDEPGLAGVTIYLDSNDNGVFDPGEPATETISDQTGTRTDEAGQYTLPNVAPGTHVLRAQTPALFAPTHAAAGWVVTVAPSDRLVSGLDFGFQSTLPGSFSGRVWMDADQNGAFGPFENGIAGVRVYLDLDGDCTHGPTEPFAVTAADDPNTAIDERGDYSFASVPPGPVVVRQIVPGGQVAVSPGGGQQVVSVPGNAHLAGVDFANDGTIGVTVTPSHVDLTLAPGETLVTQVSYAFAPLCFQTFPIEPVASDATASFTNLSGIAPTNCGGIVNTFDVEFGGQADTQCFHVEFIDDGGFVSGMIPVRIVPEPSFALSALMGAGCLVFARRNRER